MDKNSENRYEFVTKLTRNRSDHIFKFHYLTQIDFLFEIFSYDLKKKDRI